MVVFAISIPYIEKKYFKYFRENSATDDVTEHSASVVSSIEHRYCIRTLHKGDQRSIHLLEIPFT